MAKINVILQGFVNLNLETNEKLGTQFVTNTSQDTSSSTQTTTSEEEISLIPPVSVEEVAFRVGIEPTSIVLAHVQGSRIYGVDSQDSDWDIAVVNTTEEDYSIRAINIAGFDFDIHSYSVETFQQKLNRHEMNEIEILFHPEEAVLIEKSDFSIIIEQGAVNVGNTVADTKVDKNKLIQTVVEESDSLWRRAEQDFNNPGIDNYNGKKKIWHAIRFLLFAIRIIKAGRIYFDAANPLRKEIVDSEQDSFSYYQQTYGPTRNNLINEVRSFFEGNLEPRPPVE